MEELNSWTQVRDQFEASVGWWPVGEINYYYYLKMVIFIG